MTLKRPATFIVALAFLLTLVAPSYAAKRDDTERTASENRDLSGQYYDEIFGDGDSYQVVSVTPTEANDGFLVAYIAEEATTLQITAVDEDTNQTILAESLPVPEGNGTVLFPASLDQFPQYYRVDAVLLGGGEAFTWYAHTRAYQQFLSMRPDDGSFDGRVILDYGQGFDGADNFAVVGEDVKVVYVDTLESVYDGGDEDSAALFSMTESACEGEYHFPVAENRETLNGLNSGDKVLVFPRNDVNDAKTFIVDSIESSATLLSEDALSEVTVIPAETETQLEEFFDFVRIHAEIEATEQDIDTSDADSDVEEIENDEAQLLGSYSKSASRTFSFNRNFSGVQVTDNFTLSATIRLSVDYYWLTLKSVSVSVSLNASNRFTVRANYGLTYQNQWYLGTIPAGNVSGVSFSIPVYITFYANLGASMNFTANQSAGASITATYSGGRYGCTTSKWASASKSLDIRGYTTVRLGVKASLQANISFIPLYMGVAGEVGAEIKGSMQNARTFSGELNVYLQPGFFIRWRNSYIVNRLWSISRSRISSLYFSRDAYYSISDLSGYTDSEIRELLEEYKDEGLAVTIETAEELRTFAEYVNAGKNTEEICFFLNLEEGVLNLNGTAWTPVGTTEFPFRGEFDGKGATIAGLTVSSDGDCAGLFGAIRGATVHDVNLSGASVAGKSYVGGIAGRVEDNSQIYDVSVSGQVKGSEEQIGAIVGRLEASSLLNSFSSASVSGTYAGGLVGTFTCNSVSGQLANCYSVGQVTSSGVCGGVCGQAEKTNDNQNSAESARRYPELGVKNCYYLQADGIPAIGATSQGVVSETWAITEAQVKGTASNAIGTSGYAAASALLDALNGWYQDYGALILDGEKTDGVPDGNSSDYYNRWYQETEKGAYPSFAAPEKTYPLTVYYVYADGSEVRPSTTLYLRLGERFDVDPYHIEGYTTNVDDGGYSGYMNPDPTKADYEWADADKESFTGIEYRIIYTPVSKYDGTGASLAGGSAKSGGVYEIASQADLSGLAAYVNAGGNTRGVTFEQTAEIAVSGALASIGSEAAPFRGSYRGNYLAVTGLSVPLFGATDGATLEALNLSANISAYSGNAGALAGRVKDSAVSDCQVNLTADVTGDYAGGLVGYAENSDINGCSVAGSVKGSASAGGLAGGFTGGCLRNSGSSASAEGAEAVGGLIGSLLSGSVENCYASGSVKGGSNAGGFAGNVSGGQIRNVYASGAVSGSARTGAAFGSLSNATVSGAHYLNAVNAPAVGAGNANGISSFAADATDALIAQLNDWVAATTSADYRIWVPVEDSGNAASSYPVLGGAFSGWLMNFRIANNQVTYRFDREKLGDGSVYIVAYSKAGKMLTLREVTQSGDGAVAVDESAAYAQCFVLDDAFCPLSAGIRTAD